MSGLWRYALRPRDNLEAHSHHPALSQLPIRPPACHSFTQHLRATRPSRVTSLYTYTEPCDAVPELREAAPPCERPTRPCAPRRMRMPLLQLQQLRGKPRACACFSVRSTPRTRRPALSIVARRRTRPLCPTACACLAMMDANNSPRRGRGTGARRSAGGTRARSRAADVWSGRAGVCVAGADWHWAAAPGPRSAVDLCTAASVSELVWRAGDGHRRCAVAVVRSAG